MRSSRMSWNCGSGAKLLLLLVTAVLLTTAPLLALLLLVGPGKELLLKLWSQRSKG
jgi:hypothetical protein